MTTSSVLKYFGQATCSSPKDDEIGDRSKDHSPRDTLLDIISNTTCRCMLLMSFTRHIEVTVIMSTTPVNSSFLLQRRLKLAESKRLSTANTRQQQQQQPNNVRTQKKKLDGFLEKTQSKLTISTTDTSCSSSLSQILANHSFEYQISTMPSPSQHKQTCSRDSMEDSFADSFATFAMSSTAHDVATLYKEWRSLYVNAGNSENHADDEDEGDDTKEEFPSDEMTYSHLDAKSQTVNQVTIDGSLSDLLSAQHTIESSTDTMIPPNHRIQTPRTSAACSFNFNFLSVVKKKFMSQMPAQEKDETRVYDDKSHYSNDDSSCSEKSDSSDKTKNFIQADLLRYDEGETTVKMKWTFGSSEAGSADSEFS